MNAKISDICKITGFSTGTVSEALKGKKRVAEKTRKKVQEVAKQLNYTPNSLGRALQSQRSSMMGYFCIDITKSILGDVFHELTFAATANDYGILFQTPINSSASEIDRIDFLLSKNVECIMTSGCKLETWKYLLELKKRGIPVVATLCYSHIDGIPHVVTDDYLGGEMAANHLLELKHKKMAFFHPSRYKNYRETGFHETLLKNNIKPFATCNSIEQLVNLCSLPPTERITAIFAYCDVDALVAKHCVEKLGLRVPEDISIIGFDNSEISSLDEVNLSTFIQSTKIIGEQTINNVVEQIKGKTTESILVPPILKQRKSTAVCNI